MIDPKLLRQSAADVAANFARRGYQFDADAYLSLEERRKALQMETEQLQSERNANAKSVGKAKAQGEDIEPLLAAVKDLGERLANCETALQDVQSQLRDIELDLPNLLDEHARAMCDIVALAFQTDRTRIATLLLTNNLSGQVYPFLGLNGDSS